MIKKRNNYLNWKQSVNKELKGRKISDLYSKTPDGIEIKPLYTLEDLKNLQQIYSYPGTEPYLRGPKATMYPNKPWTLRQYAGFSTAEESNKFYTLIFIDEVVLPYIQSFEEVKGAVINDYQDDIEKQWLKELRDKYKVEVNTKVLKRVKKELNQ